MKNLTLLLLLIYSVSNAQRGDFAPNDHNWFISIGIDPKMALYGVHDDGGVFNPEFRGGVEFENTRVWMGYEFLSEIKYKKFTYFAFDYKAPILRNERFSTMIGLEASVIQRKQNEFWQRGMRYTGSDENLSFGANAELNYWILPELSIYANYNVFLAEKFDNFRNEMKMVRQDVMVGVIFKFL